MSNQNDGNTCEQPYGNLKRHDWKAILTLILTALTLLATIIGVIISKRSADIAESDASPYFTVSTKQDENLNMVTIIRNEGGNIHNVQCKRVCFVKLTCTEGKRQKEFWTLIDSCADIGTYDYETHDIKIAQSMLNTPVTFTGYFEPLFLFSLDEELYKDWKESNQEIYTVKEISYDFKHCIMIDYKDYQDKECRAYLELTSNDYNFLKEKDVPAVNSSSIFTLDLDSPVDYCSHIFEAFGIKFTIVDGKFTFQRD